MRERLYVFLGFGLAVAAVLLCAGDARAVDRDGARSWPVPGPPGAPRPVVVRGWDPPASPWGAGHRGVDLGTAVGAEVRAAAAGRVSFAGSVAGRGVVTVTLRGTGEPPLRVTYEPVRAAVEVGDVVRAGDVVGRVQGGPFHCARACLHWGLLRGQRYLNPVSLLPEWMLRAGRFRLLPFLDVPVPRDPRRAQSADGLDCRARPAIEDRRGGRLPGPRRVSRGRR